MACMCSPKGYGFKAVLVTNGGAILPIFVINRAWFLHSSRKLRMLSEEDAFSSLLIKYIHKDHS